MSQRGADTPKTPPALKDSGAKGGGGDHPNLACAFLKTRIYGGQYL